MKAGPRFNRTKPNRRPYKRFLIVCEGEKSEPNYINGLRPICRTPLIEIEIIPGAGATKKLVERAAEKKKDARKAARKSGDRFDTYDEVWCVMDVDDHPRLAEALKQAKDNKIEVALSNPCYELWVILHHRDHRKDMDRGALQSECANHYNCENKHIPFELLWPDYEAAKTRAQNLRAWQIGMGRIKGNPWTNFDELVEAILGIRRT